MSFFQTSKNLKLEGGFGDLQEARNTVYLERAIVSLRTRDNAVVDDELLKHLSPLGWEHINLTGDYVWKKSSKLKEGKFRPLRSIRFS